MAPQTIQKGADPWARGRHTHQVGAGWEGPRKRLLQGCPTQGRRSSNADPNHPRRLQRGHTRVSEPPLILLARRLSAREALSSPGHWIAHIRHRQPNAQLHSLAERMGWKFRLPPTDRASLSILRVGTFHQGSCHLGQYLHVRQFHLSPPPLRRKVAMPGKL